jgi:hypothetical protein
MGWQCDQYVQEGDAIRKQTKKKRAAYKMAVAGCTRVAPRNHSL